MLSTYELILHGTTHDVTTAARVIDKILRANYNVYGGKLVAAFKGQENEQVYIMRYTAYWIENGMWYDMHDIIKVADLRIEHGGIKDSEKPNDGKYWRGKLIELD